jgi:exosortase A-associated hydrolase 2
LFVPPFAEELNKSRRMVALAARAFALRGWAVLQFDLLGCGDSAGDFADATWLAWLDDVTLGHAWLKTRLGCEPGLWSLRAGSLLASDWLASTKADVPWLAWQPVINGKQHLNQFLRLKAASEMLADADAKAAMNGLRAAMQRGETVEVAGYALSSGLVSGMEQSVMRFQTSYRSPVGMFEIGSAEASEVSPGLGRLVGDWVQSGVAVSVEFVPGNAFWQTQEIELAPALIERSVVRLEKFP